jgi:hypothetical protein
MIVPSQLALKPTQILHVPLDKLVDRFPLPLVAPPIGDTSLTHIMRLAAHSTTSPPPTAMGQSFIMTLYLPFRYRFANYLSFVNLESTPRFLYLRKLQNVYR